MYKLRLGKKTIEPKESPTSDVKVRLTFYLKNKEAEQLRSICDAEDISISQKIRQHVRQLLQHHQQ